MSIEVRIRGLRRCGVLKVLLGLALVAWGAVSLAKPALADPLDLVLAPAAVQADQALVDDEALSGIRGRGAEGPEIAAPEFGDVAVQLWDELKRSGHQQGQSGSGSGFSQSSGANNLQATSLTMVRY